MPFTNLCLMVKVEKEVYSFFVDSVDIAAKLFVNLVRSEGYSRNTFLR